MASSVGQIVGSAVFGRLADMIGRRPVVLISLSVSVVGGACVVAIPTAEHATVFGWPCYSALMAALWLLGFGFGGSISPMGIMLAEILPVRGRGFWLNCTTSAFQVAVGGKVIECWISISTYSITAMVACIFEHIQWRSARNDFTTSAFQVGSVGVAVAAAYIMPDSSRIQVLGFSGWRLLYAAEVWIYEGTLPFVTVIRCIRFTYRDSTYKSEWRGIMTKCPRRGGDRGLLPAADGRGAAGIAALLGGRRQAGSALPHPRPDGGARWPRGASSRSSPWRCCCRWRGAR